MKKILIYNSGGGLGDAIQLFTLILSIKKSFFNSKLFYLGSHDNHFEGKLKEYNIKLENLNLNLKYFGFRLWHLFFVKKKFKKTNIINFDLIIDLQSKLRNSLILKQIPHSYFYSSTVNYRLCTIKNDYKYKDHLKNLSLMFGKEIIEEKYNINNLNKNLMDEAKRLLPTNNYVGFSLTQGNAYRKKSWSLNNFILLANELVKRKKNPCFFYQRKSKIN